jgi:hypothetical protein
MSTNIETDEHNQESAQASRADFQPYLTDENTSRQDAGLAEAHKTVGKILGCPTIVGKDGTIYLQGHISNDPEGTFNVPSASDMEKIGVGFARGVGHSTQATLEFLAQPDAVNNAAASFAQEAKDDINYYTARPDRLAPDVEAASCNAGQVLVDSLGHPLPPDRIGELAGSLMMTFTPIGGIKALGFKELEALGGAEKLEQMSAAELEQLGLKRTHSELQPASPELLAIMRRHIREIKIAEPGSDEWKYLETLGVNGSSLGQNSILLKQGSSKITAIEEFLHGTQARIESCHNVPTEILEVRVKDFMIRHSKMLGLNHDDVSALNTLKLHDFAYAQRRGFTQYEIEGKQQ